MKKISFYGKSFILLFLIVIFEGALRKWVNPSFGIPLLGARDLIVIFLLIKSIKKRYLKFNKPPEIIVLIWTIIVFIWTSIHIILGLIPVAVGLFVFHFWILYLWLALVGYRTLTAYDTEKIMKVLLFSLIPMVILTVTQFFSPVDSFINKQVGSIDGEGVFQVIAGIVRATGTFSFSMGYSSYLAFLTPLIFWLMSSKGFIKNALLKNIIILLYFIGVLVSGSRAAIFFSIGMFAVYLVTFFLSSKFKQIKIRTVLLSTILIITVGYYAYPFLEMAYNANMSRIEDASKSENVQTRIVDTFLGNKRTWDRFTLLGHGIGGGSNAARPFMSSNGEEFIMGEMEVDRILTESGIVGIIFELLKVFLIIYALFKTFRMLIKYKITLPFLFWFYLSIQLLTTSTTGQITVQAFVFLSLAIGFKLLQRKTVYKLEEVK